MVYRRSFLLACMTLLVLAGNVFADPVVTREPLFPNSGFENGNLDNWTQTVGTAWLIASGTDFLPHIANAPEGTYAASTFFPQPTIPETEQATLKSINFTVPAGKDTVQFYMAGWSDPFIHVDFKKASDNSVVFTQTRPGTAAQFALITLTGFSAYAGQELYIEAVDDNLGGDPAVNGWLGVDGFAYVSFSSCTSDPDLAFPNADFESGDFTNWTVNGDAFAVSSTTWPSDGYQCNYHATSFTNESFTGWLESIPFTMSTNLVRFKIGGWRDRNDGGGENWNYVTLNRASDGAELDRVLAPNITGTMATEYLDGRSAIGQNVYIVIVDEGWDFGFSWMTADDFILVEGLPPCDAYPDLAFPNADFETGDLTGWTVEGDAFSTPGTTWPSSGFHCNFLGSSFPTGEPKTGSIQSPPFLLTKTGVSFKIGGWTNTPGNAENWNYVTLHRASDNTELDRVLAPNITGVMKNEMLNGTAALNQNVYVKVTDDAAAAGFAWLTVDAFRIVDYFPPEKRSWPITISKVPTPPTIDGNIEDPVWNSLPAASKVDMRLSTLSIADPNDPTFLHDGGVVPGAAPNAGTIVSDADASGLYYFAWDNNALYIAADVKDEDINANTVSKQLHGGDAFRVCLDYDQISTTTAHTDGKAFFPTVAAAASTGTATTEDSSKYFSAYWPNTAPNPMTGTQWGVTVTEGSGYKVELAIPWTAFEVSGATFTNPFPPVVGQKMGVLVSINDHDGGTGKGITFMFPAGGGASFGGEEPGNVIVRRTDMYPEATFASEIVKVDDWSLY